jgi:REP element-mobilizing transposase RayT
MAERLRRLETIHEKQPIYFVTACTAERRELLANEPIHETFLRFVANASARGAWVGRYVLMPDHLHLFLVLEDDRIRLSEWVRSMKNAISKALRAHSDSSPCWQKGFFDHVMRGGESYSQKWEYVRANPVRAGLVSRPEDWPYAGEIQQLEYRKDLLL